MNDFEIVETPRNSWGNDKKMSFEDEMEDERRREEEAKKKNVLVGLTVGAPLPSESFSQRKRTSSSASTLHKSSRRSKRTRKSDTGTKSMRLVVYPCRSPPGAASESSADESGACPRERRSGLPPSPHGSS